MNKLFLKKALLYVIIVFLPAVVFSQSQNMNLQANWDESPYNYNDVWGYVDNSKNEYAIIGSENKVFFLNINNPANPQKIAEFTPGSTTNWRDIKTFGHYAYAVSEGLSNEGLVIFDLCAIDEGVVSQVYQKNEVFGKAHNLFVDAANEILYVVGSDTKSDGLIIFDLSNNPSEPQLLSEKTLPGGYVHDIFIKDDIAFCSHGFKGLYIYDVSNPIAPILKANLNTNGYNHSSWGMKEDGLLIYAQEIPIGMPLGILNYSNYLENDLSPISNFKEPLLGPDYVDNTAHNPYVIGDYAVVSYYEDGVVIFDLTDPSAPTRVAYYDTYSNGTYSGYEGCWGVYPFLPSGNILASDISNGLFIIKPTFDLDNNCNNGKKDWNEENIDCGGVCASCTPCNIEICDNNIDDDRDGKTDCEDESCSCSLNQATIEASIMLEGFLDESTGLMSTSLMTGDLLPTFQPFKISPFDYNGVEQVEEMPIEAVDWVLVEARHSVILDSVLARKACILLKDGSIIESDGTLGIQFKNLSEESIHLVIRNRGHLAVMSRELLDLSQTKIIYDFTANAEKAMGNDQLKLKGNYFCLYAGDFDQNGIINSVDFNIWKQNSALVNRYLSWDADGNGIINVLDFNYWKVNRSKIGEPMIQF